MGKILKTINTIIDKETGEVERIETTSIKTIKADNFIQVYLHDLQGFFNLETKVEIKIMGLIWRDSSPNYENSNEGNKIVIVKEIKEGWAKEAETSLQTINNIITNFVKKALLYKKGRSVYFLNANYFFKGSLKDRPKVIENIIKYEIDYKKSFEDDKNLINEMSNSEI